MFEDQYNKDGLDLMQKLSDWCKNQTCNECVFACDVDGVCQLSTEAPCYWNKDNIVKEATYELRHKGDK